MIWSACHASDKSKAQRKTKILEIIWSRRVSRLIKPTELATP